MSTITRIIRFQALLACAVFIAASGPLYAQSRYEAVHTFTGNKGGPNALVEGPDGRLYGTTVAGGFFGKGTVYSVDAMGNMKVLHEFAGGEGESPRGRLLVESDGTVYGTASQSRGGQGTIFRISPEGTFETLVQFSGENGANPQAGLVRASDGHLYGTTTAGGEFFSGTVFRLSAEGVHTILVSFDWTNGANPLGELTEAVDGLYGTTRVGGAVGLGTVFRVALADDTLSTIADFDGADGGWPFGGLFLASDGTWYGTTEIGGTYGEGTLYRMAGNAIEALHSFSAATDGSFASGQLVELSDGIYGTTENGINNSGTVFRWSPEMGFETLGVFTGAEGTNPKGGVIQTASGAIVGTTHAGGAGGFGTIFELLPTQAIRTIASFVGSEGADPSAPLVQVGEHFYGTTYLGGAHGLGTVFRLAGGCSPQPVASGCATTIASFGPETGANPSGGLVLGKDGHLYGTTEAGGDGNEGIVFRVTLDGTLTSLASFDVWSSGSMPLGGLIEAADGQLYGTTWIGAGFSQGGIFTVVRNDDGSGTIASVATFDGMQGDSPTGGLIQAPDGTFYGVAEGGGDNGTGTVFKLSATGELSALASFGPGELPFMASSRLLLASDGHLYGTTASGGETNDGTIFQVSLDGALTTLASFDYATTGTSPYQQGLIEAADGSIYGTTTGDGFVGFGTVYKWSAENGIEIVHAFDGLTGDGPNSTIVQAWDGSLYGTARGPQGGVIYRIVTKQPSTLVVSPATGNQSGSTTVSATLTVEGEPLADAEIAFSLRGVHVGVATTGLDGIARLSGVSLAGMTAGLYSGAITASFAGNTGVLASTGSGDLLIIVDKPPVLKVPTSMVVNATSPAGAKVDYPVTATDDSGLPVTISCSPASGSTFRIGKTTVSCTATDSGGNKTTGEFTIKVLSAAEQIVALVEKLRGMPLSPAVKSYLVGLLQKALADPRKVAFVCDLLRGFAAYAKVKCPATLAASLIADVTRIRAVIGCG